ncbi:MAG TPA: RGCVC family protein [Kutzneria sp.]|jgi:hypothetical protein|nr:RGCVC family protein [Kutzneria sp.]
MSGQAARETTAGAPLRREGNDMVMRSVHFGWLTRPGDGDQSQVLPGSANATPDLDTAAATCPVCPHPADAHDKIGARYCAATAAGEFERGCVCVTGKSDG